MAFSQRGFIPIIAIILIAIASAVVIKTNPTLVQKITQSFNKTSSPSPTASGLEGSSSPSPSPVSTGKITKTASPTPTPVASKSSTNSTSQSSPGSSSSNSSTSTSAPTATSTPTPAPTPKSYTWNGNNINVTTKCYVGDTTFDIQMSGNVATTAYNDGVWTTLTGNGSTIIVSYDQGNYMSPQSISYNFNDQVTSIRAQSPVTLNTSGSTTYSYEIKAYSGAYTSGTPSLSYQIGSASFATDCK